MCVCLGLINPGCFSSNTIQHELLHVLGFFHEESRPDRDDYLQINLDNVDPNQVEINSKEEFLFFLNL